jgi:2-keto-4-pentenoate hydratase/2-oxohepta-3-ene-1,7-dioic acid hydratase in catechol pathway
VKIARVALGRGAQYVRVEGDGNWYRPLPVPGDAPTGDLLESGALLATGEEAGEPATLAGVRLLAPIVRPGKIVAIGLNYVDHAAEAGRVLPTEPIVFAKFPSAIIGTGADITWSRAVTDAVDFEAELAVVIGRPARRVRREGALDHVAFYTCLNDISARDLQAKDGQWVRGKSLDTFCPIGPVLVSPDEIGNVGDLRISCMVSGEVLQDASTADLLFDVAELIHRLSYSFTLEPGDVIATGTPPGVGWFRDPKRPLRDGDHVVVAIEGIGSLENTVRLYEAVDQGDRRKVVTGGVKPGRS